MPGNWFPHLRREEEKMLRFNHITVFLKRPITVISVSDALGVKSFELADKAPKREALNFRTLTQDP